MIYSNLKLGSYYISWLISMALIAPLITVALIPAGAAMLMARSRETREVLNHPGAAGQLLRWVYGWKAADRYLTWVAKITGIYH